MNKKPILFPKSNYIVYLFKLYTGLYTIAKVYTIVCQHKRSVTEQNQLLFKKLNSEYRYNIKTFFLWFFVFELLLKAIFELQITKKPHFMPYA
jgi:hypothetical protein